MFVPHFLGVGELFLLRGKVTARKMTNKRVGLGEGGKKYGKFPTKFPCRVFSGDRFLKLRKHTKNRGAFTAGLRYPIALKMKDFLPEK